MTTNITWQDGKVGPAERARLLGQRPVTVWLTGLSGSGKSTIAFELEHRLVAGGRACFVLDGDNVRHGLNRALGFSPPQRKENIPRIAEVARRFNEAGLIVVTAFISPYREDRSAARAILGEDRFVETYLAADLRTCEARDRKGLYARARAGEIAEFTDISALYEPPQSPEIVLSTGIQHVDESVVQILRFLEPLVAKRVPLAMESTEAVIKRFGRTAAGNRSDSVMVCIWVKQTYIMGFSPVSGALRRACAITRHVEKVCLQITLDRKFLYRRVQQEQRTVGRTEPVP